MGLLRVAWNEGKILNSGVSRMLKSEIVTVLADLMLVAGGAAIVVAGKIVHEFYANRLSAAKSRDAEYRAKIEELVAVAYEVETWLKKEQDYYLYSKERVLEQPPMSRVGAIAAIYFPSIEDQAKLLDIAANEYLLWAMGLKKSGQIPPTMDSENMAKVEELYGAVLKRRTDLVKAARNLMNEQYMP